MLDFLKIETKRVKLRNEDPYIEIFPKFVIKKSEDLMIRGRDFYAVWNKKENLWSTDEQTVLELVDEELAKKYQECKDSFSLKCKVSYMWDASTGSIDRWHKYCQKQMRDSYKNLDEKLIFANHKTVKSDYASKQLPYPLEKGDISAYDKLISTLYSPEERAKIEWAIGAVVSGDSKTIQKFMVFYGSAGTGKSTILNLMSDLFSGYCGTFSSQALGSASASFALEPFRNNPLVAIEHDGDLSRIENNTRINSLVSHEKMSVNEKNKSIYAMKFNAFLFIGTNKPVRITDGKSGLIRRLIDVTPTGNTLPKGEYNRLVKQMSFELGAIAQHCLDIYKAEPGKYDRYVPISMLSASNDFYNFVYDSYFVFQKEDGTTMKAAWEMYKTYCEDAKVAYPMSQRAFKEELKNYFEEWLDRYTLPDGTRVRSYYHGFKTKTFQSDEVKPETKKDEETPESWIVLKEQPSLFDNIAQDYPAQYLTDDESRARRKWENNKYKLKDICTKKLHFVQVPVNHIVIDFDLKDSEGNKCLVKNIEMASKWPPTYCEVSKGGQGLHLHYIYTGDKPEDLARLYDEDIEVKVFTGDSALRRRLSLCNDIPIAEISSGLQKKKVKKKMIDSNQIKSEAGLRRMIERNLNKEIHPNTTQSINFIVEILNGAYNSGLKYDISDMTDRIVKFAANSTHQSEYCLLQIDNMKLHSEEPMDDYEFEGDAPIVFFDIEIFPNLFIVNWKKQGMENPVQSWINPAPWQIEKLLKYRLVGFNNRNYDNHLIYARLIGKTEQELYDISQGIIGKTMPCPFPKARDLSYTDIYDFAAKKQSLKKWEIELGIHHKELGLPWDKPVPEELWDEVADYCTNDVEATEAVFNHLQGDFAARKILAELANEYARSTPNDPTKDLAARFVFEGNMTPQKDFIYTDLSKEFPGYKFDKYAPKGKKSTYLGEEIGEGGRVFANPGIYENVGLYDIASMHPHTIIFLKLFGSYYTKRFEQLVQARIAVKHRDLDKLDTLLNGCLAKYKKASEEFLDTLTYALKIVINSIYGLTSALFPNPFRDPRNIDNIVAKRGALFMTKLQKDVEALGYTVAHIKTDSIKVPNADPEIEQFIMEEGKKKGYTFEHEATYDRMCLVNDAVYIARYSDDKEINGKHAGQWTATGTQFQVPFVFKTLFSHEPIGFDDLCETKTVTSALYLDMNEDLPDVSELEKTRDKLMTKLRKLEKDGEADSDMAKDISRQIEELGPEIDKGHNYVFVGKVGRFCPVKEGTGGGVLMREQNGKMVSATGAKGYRWVESESIRGTDREETIDRSYYINMANDAIEAISKYGDFNKFVSLA